MTMPVIMDGKKPIPQERVDEICSRLSVLSFVHAVNCFNRDLFGTVEPSNLSYFDMLVDDPTTKLLHQVKFKLQDEGLMDVYGEIPSDIRVVYLSTKHEAFIWEERGAKHLSRFPMDRKEHPSFFTAVEFLKGMEAYQADMEEESLMHNELVLLERHKAAPKLDPIQPAKARWGTTALRVMRFPGLGT